MIDTLIGALKISLNECNRTEHPADYIHQLNEVLNRYKTNLYKMIPDKVHHLYDPKEFIQIRLCLSWKIKMSLDGVIVITERSPVMVHINGFVPELGLRKNREKSFIKAVDVSDVVNLEKIAQIKTDYHLGMVEGESAINIIHNHLGEEASLGLGVYFTQDKYTDNQRALSMQISARVYWSVDKDDRSFVTDEDRQLTTARERDYQRRARIANAASVAAAATLREAPHIRNLKVSFAPHFYVE